ncbi:AmmeMemoRadiSam system radical SAM enzyme [Desulfuribacillus alkaliarsenatis]|uniref:AmmeMemoRadiSam system radical SAM enzyme n=1 Tax=Desulfuribacillus alkaliarsenatis TaxID=766136 RepID=A0A1E5FZ55_9FIRM|nr:AmmeMemoRadiSam system radical SAM enzyme [Desulfuribacillus alkaliarsenatis]OEF95853.1 AmmeMemoRadiSam system radical SAM enzyme [Desulfuribacillus alkaliarsenatis]
MKEALFYERESTYVICKLCPHHCHLKDTKIGKCGMRQNNQGILYSLNYGKIAALQIDPIEKKPLYQFLPGTKTLSFGSFGCNFTCVFCQNHHIAQEKDIKSIAPTSHMIPEQIVGLALEYDTPSISYTYNEPTIFYEFMLDTAKLAKEKQLSNVIVSNGYIEEEPLKELLPYIDAVNIDLKSFTNDCYTDYMGGMLEPVKRTIEIAAKRIHVEVTTLVVTKINDNIEEIEELAAWLASIRSDIPLHLSRYFPNYKYDEQATELQLMYKAEQVAKKHLQHVYLGNM